MTNTLLELAKEAAISAAAILKENFGRIKVSDIREKEKNDFLTFVDEKTEEKIIKIIHASCPEHDILAEESGQKNLHSPYLWIIDPLDGTKNYISGIPIFGISIALQIDNQLHLGVVYDPTREELFYASKNEGAFLNGRKLTVSTISNLGQSLIATGFPFKFKDFLNPYVRSFQDMFSNCTGIRRMGSACLDLAYLAAGRFEGFWELGLNSWDMAAGAILIEEAGGKVSDFWGNSNYLENSYIVASNGLIHSEILDITKTHFPEYKHTK